MGKTGKKQKLSKQPFVSVCTPTFNRRPFIPHLIRCFEQQLYPKDKMEWIIIDDGQDKIEDLVSHIPQVKYFKYENKLKLGHKRNLLHEKSKGDVIVYMDDDDYYPPERVSHAVETLVQNPKALCVGSSKLYTYFHHINKVYQFGPYGEKHATAASLAFKRDLLKKTSFSNDACLAEEKLFLKNYTIPLVQLDAKKTILVLSHNQNTADKTIFLNNNNPHVHETTFLPKDFILDNIQYDFYIDNINSHLDNYNYGKLENKPDVINATKQIFENHSKISEENKKKREFNELKNQMINSMFSS